MCMHHGTETKANKRNVIHSMKVGQTITCIYASKQWKTFHTNYSVQWSLHTRCHWVTEVFFSSLFICFAWTVCDTIHKVWNQRKTRLFSVSHFFISTTIVFKCYCSALLDNPYKFYECSILVAMYRALNPIVCSVELWRSIRKFTIFGVVINIIDSTRIFILFNAMQYNNVSFYAID